MKKETKELIGDAITIACFLMCMAALVVQRKALDKAISDAASAQLQTQRAMQMLHEQHEKGQP